MQQQQQPTTTAAAAAAATLSELAPCVWVTGAKAAAKSTKKIIKDYDTASKEECEAAVESSADN